MSLDLHIGITAYSEGELLIRAWQSILNQSNADWNAVMVLDGGGDEETKKVFDAIKHPKLNKYKFEENQGPYISRTKAIELTNTEWFYFLDGDDTLPKDAVEIFYRYVRDEHSYFYGNVELFRTDGSIKIIKNKDFAPSSMILKKKSPAVVAFKKELFYELKGYDSRLLRGRADYDFLFKLYRSGKQGVYVDEIVYRYHLRNSSVSKSYAGEIGNRNLIIYYNHRDLFDSDQLRYNFLFKSLVGSFYFNLKEKNIVRTKLYSLRILFHFPNNLTIYEKALYSSPYIIQKNFLLIKRQLTSFKRLIGF